MRKSVDRLPILARGRIIHDCVCDQAVTSMVVLIELGDKIGTKAGLMLVIQPLLQYWMKNNPDLTISVQNSEY